jgi:hypothetical protein
MIASPRCISSAIDRPTETASGYWRQDNIGSGRTKNLAADEALAVTSEGDSGRASGRTAPGCCTAANLFGERRQQIDVTLHDVRGQMLSPF